MWYTRRLLAIPAAVYKTCRKNSLPTLSLSALKPILNLPSAQLFSSRERERESKLYTRIFVFILLSPCIPSPLLYDAILFTPPPWILFTSPFRSLRVLSSLVSRGIGVNYRHGINPYYYYYYYKLSRFSSKGKLEIRINCLNNAIYIYIMLFVLIHRVYNEGKGFDQRQGKHRSICESNKRKKRGRRSS